MSWFITYRSPRAWHWNLEDFQWVFWMCCAKWKTPHDRVVSFCFDLLFPFSSLPFFSYKVCMSVRSPHGCKQDYIHIQHSYIHAKHKPTALPYNRNRNVHRSRIHAKECAYTTLRHMPLTPFYLKILTSS